MLGFGFTWKLLFLCFYLLTMFKAFISTVVSCSLVLYKTLGSKGLLRKYLILLFNCLDFFFFVIAVLVVIKCLCDKDG